MTKHTVKEKETLLQISNQYGFKNTKPVLDANLKIWPHLYLHPTILAPGMSLTIPDIKGKDVERESGSNSVFVVNSPSNQYLRLTIEDPSGAIRSIDDIKVKINGDYFDIDLLSSEHPTSTLHWKWVRLLKPLPDKLSDNCSLEIKAFSIKGGFHTETMQLYIGDLDPIIDPLEPNKKKETDHTSPKKAVQKILTNLGYYDGKIEGNLDEEESKAAISKFQNDYILDENIAEYGVADQLTCIYLVAAEKNYMGVTQSIKNAVPKKNDKNRPLFSNKGDQSINVYSKAKPIDLTLLAPLKTYNEHTSHNPLKKKPEPTSVNSEILLFPKSAYVAPCVESPDSIICYNQNLIKGPVNKFIFLDSGRWLGENRDFGLVWGRHVYLCNYNTPHEKGNSINLGKMSRSDGLDYKFFKKMKDKVKIVSWDTAEWGMEQDYEWEKMYIIIPDLHLKTKDNHEVWKKTCTLEPEFDLLKFSIAISQKGELSNKLKIIQIGDAYDLWVGYGFITANSELSRNLKKGSPVLEYKIEPLFEDNSYEAMELKQHKTIVLDYNVNERIDTYEKLREFIEDIQGLRKPWVLDVYHTTKLAYEAINNFDKNNFKEENTNFSTSKSTKTIQDPNADLWPYLDLGDGRYLNPAELALRILQDRFGDNMIYIYGNHDNYLIDPKVCDKAGLKYHRVAYYENNKGLYVEHAHRMEATFASEITHDNIAYHIPRNNDGVWSGFQSTNILYLAKKDIDMSWLKKHFYLYTEDKADPYAASHDQPGYMTEFAKMMIGRLASKNKIAPHIFVIGHTHMPTLNRINIKFDFY